MQSKDKYEIIYGIKLIVLCIIIAVLLSSSMAINGYNFYAKDGLGELPQIEPLQEEMATESVITHEEVKHVSKELKTADMREITLTNYYNGDKDGSNSTTGSMKSTKDFEVNELGWYTYQGMVVIATATYECMKSKSGGCQYYNSLKDLPSGYGIYHYYDIINFEVDGVRYDGIVLDSCGASWWAEDKQRFDIMIADRKYAFGKMEAVLYE